MTNEEIEYENWLINQIQHHKKLLQDIARYRLHCDNSIIVELQQFLTNYQKLTGKKYK